MYHEMHEGGPSFVDEVLFELSVEQFILCWIGQKKEKGIQC